MRRQHDGRVKRESRVVLGGRPHSSGRLREAYDFVAWNFWLLARIVVLLGLFVLLVYTMALYRDPIAEELERFLEAVARFFQGPAENG